MHYNKQCHWVSNERHLTSIRAQICIMMHEGSPLSPKPTVRKHIDKYQNQIMNTIKKQKQVSTWLKSTYALQHLASCSQEIEKKLLATPLTLCSILKKEKVAPREQNSVRFELLPNINFRTVPNVAALTFAEIHTPPQVVKVRLPDLHVICCLNETRI